MPSHLTFINTPQSKHNHSFPYGETEPLRGEINYQLLSSTLLIPITRKWQPRDWDSTVRCRCRVSNGEGGSKGGRGCEFSPSSSLCNQFARKYFLLIYKINLTSYRCMYYFSMLFGFIKVHIFYMHY